MNTRKIINLALGIATLSLFVACAPSSSNDSKKAQTFQNSQDIIGGTDSTSDFQKANGVVGVLMVFKTGAGEQAAICTGSLISKNVVLTAAHCLVAPPESELVAALLFFDKNLDKVMEEVNNNDLTHVRVINNAIRHEKYLQGRGTDNDIGLIRFEGAAPAGFVPAVLAPADLTRTIRKGTNVTLSGFGVSSYKMDSRQNLVGSGDGILRQISNIKVLGLTATGEEITLDQSQGRGACHGDSGGPAYIYDSVKKRNILVGVTSRGTEPNGLCDREAIYTGVMGYSKWIADNSKKIVQ